MESAFFDESYIFLLHVFVQFVMFLRKSVMNFSKNVMNLSDLLYPFSKKKCNFARELKYGRPEGLKIIRKWIQKIIKKHFGP